MLSSPNEASIFVTVSFLNLIGPFFTCKIQTKLSWVFNFRVGYFRCGEHILYFKCLYQWQSIGYNSEYYYKNPSILLTVASVFLYKKQGAFNSTMFLIVTVLLTSTLILIFSLFLVTDLKTIFDVVNPSLTSNVSLPVTMCQVYNYAALIIIQIYLLYLYSCKGGFQIIHVS